MGNCTGCEDQQLLEQRNEVFFDKNKKRCNENLKILRSSKKLSTENKENLILSQSKDKEPPQNTNSAKPPLKPTILIEKSSNLPTNNQSNQSFDLKNKYEPVNNSERGVLKPEATNDDPNLPRHLSKLEEMPNYLNENTQAVLEKLGGFVYDEESQELIEEFRNLPFYGPVEVDENAIYNGQWKLGKRHGRGKQVWSDGSQYEGYWFNDMANIRGRLIHVDGDVYEGEWLDDKAHGKGIYIHRDGASYEGEWYEDKQHGYGIEKWIDGASYEGDYNMGMKHGNGTFVWADGSSYIGEFLNNNIHGKGTYKWSDGREYSGDWKENKMHGKGVFSWQDGRRYEGSYLEDKKCGYGVFFWPDGRSYKGNWEDGKQNGVGFYCGSNGDEREGLWKNGRIVKWTKKN